MESTQARLRRRGVREWAKEKKQWEIINVVEKIQSLLQPLLETADLLGTTRRTEARSDGDCGRQRKTATGSHVQVADLI
jgi:hypothetical protein